MMFPRASIFLSFIRSLKKPHFSFLTLYQQKEDFFFFGQVTVHHFVFQSLSSSIIPLSNFPISYLSQFSINPMNFIVYPPYARSHFRPKLQTNSHPPSGCPSMIHPVKVLLLSLFILSFLLYYFKIPFFLQIILLKNIKKTFKIKILSFFQLFFLFSYSSLEIRFLTFLLPALTLKFYSNLQNFYQLVKIGLPCSFLFFIKFFQNIKRNEQQKNQSSQIILLKRTKPRTYFKILLVPCLQSR